MSNINTTVKQFIGLSSKDHYQNEIPLVKKPSEKLGILMGNDPIDIEQFGQ